MNHENHESNHIQRNLGLTSAITTMTGCIVGSSIFIIPSALTAANGPNAWISYLIGAVAILFSGFLYAQIGAALPVSGANYRFCTVCISPTAGFLYVLCSFIGNSFLYPILSRTGATYLTQFFPALQGHEIVVSIGIVILIGFINLMGGKVSGTIQTMLVLVLVTTVLSFTTCGIIKADWQNFSPLFPVGIFPVITGVVSTYYAFAGVNCIIDMSGDIKNPEKNIPKTIFISLLIVALMYIGMCVSLAGLIPWDEMEPSMSVATVALRTFPSWFSSLLALAALITCWTPLNSIYGSTSRVLYTMGRLRIIPSVFSKLNSRGVPYVAVLLVMIVGSVLCLFYQSVIQFVNISSFYLLSVALLMAIASLKFRQRMENNYLTSPYKLSGIWYYVWPICTILTSLVFMGVEIVTDTKFALCGIVLIPIGVLLYKLRERYLLKQEGINVSEQLLLDMQDENG